jgi:hypothetical protein
MPRLAWAKAVQMTGALQEILAAWSTAFFAASADGDRAAPHSVTTKFESAPPVANSESFGCKVQHNGLEILCKLSSVTAGSDGKTYRYKRHNIDVYFTM